MKKILSLLSVILIASCLKAQVLDTVIVRNLQLQSQDWAWLMGKYGVQTDTFSLKLYRRIRAKIQESIPPSWTTNVTIDSLPGRAVMAFYEMTLRADAGEIAPRYTAIKNAISAKANLAYWIGFVDARISAEFDRKRDIGKNILIDNQN